MSEESRESVGSDETDEQAKARRRRRLQEVFGDTMPEQTRDDVDEPSAGDGDRGDEWLRRQVPPHHG